MPSAREPRASATPPSTPPPSKSTFTRRAASPPPPASQQLEEAHKAARHAANIATRDVTAAYAATPTGVALLGLNPPGVLIMEAQKRRDEQLLQRIAPEHGMPRDIRLDMRVSVLGRRQ